jgi:hypothetical protein
MTPAQRYRRLAADLRDRAAREHIAYLTAEWENLAECYLRLAEQADANASVELSVHPIALKQTA